MSEIKNGSGTGIVVAAVVGAAVGAGIALLFAPCSGKETRGWLADRTREAKDRTTSALAHGKEAVRRAAKEIGRDSEDAARAPGRPAHVDVGATTVRG